MANWAFGAGSTGGSSNNGRVSFGGGINGVSQGIYEESSTQKAPLGSSLEFDDGRKFRYTKGGAAIAIAAVVANDTSVGLFAEADNFTTVATAGDREFTMTGGGSEFNTTAEFYAGSYILFTGGTGEGQYYRIKDHTTASSDKITFSLYDKLVTAPDGTTDIIITGGPYQQVLTADGTSPSTATDSHAVGVAPIAVSSGYYFWAQTKGICSVKADLGTTSQPHYGMELIVSSTHDGFVEAKLDAHDGYQVVGHFTSPIGDDNQYIQMLASLE